MSKGTKVTLVVLIILILLGSVGLGTFFVLKNKEPKEPEVVNKTNVLETIQGYDYYLEDRDTPLFKRTFEELRDVLNSEEIDFKKYAEVLSKLYIIDLYTIDNKINQYDVGAREFVSPDIKENFELKVKDTIYKYVEDNSYNTRQQELPIVDSVEVAQVNEETITTPAGQFPGYSVELSWVYSKDLGYDNKAVIKLIKQDKKLNIVKQDVSK